MEKGIGPLRRKRVVWIFAIVLICAALLVWFLYDGTNRLQVTRTEVAVALETPLTLVHLSDLHAKQFGPGNAALYETIERQRPDLICFTHCHGDHYDHDLVQQACWAWPRAKLILPEQAFPHQFFLEGPSMEFVFQDTVLHFFRLPHEGKAYAQVPRYGLLLSQNRFRILIAGDCEVASPALRDTLAGQSVN